MNSMPRTDLPPSDLTVRPYRESDYPACRDLWAQLTEHHRRLYEDPTIGGNDPGAGFDDYLAAPERIGTWVAEVDEAVAGMVGLFDNGTSGEVEPVVVTERLRGQAIGGALLAWAIDEAVRRGFEYLAIRPVARNVSAIRRFHDVGFRTLGGRIDLTMDLAERRHQWVSGEKLHGLDFGY